jgi:outer membrane protein OmpA-like peptidoglycan-associated protein
MILLFAALIQAAPAPAQIATPSLTPPAFRVFFDSGEAEITRDGQAVISEVANRWRETGSGRVIVSGHTDRSGTVGANLRSSANRAAAVKQALVAAGVTAAAITTQSRGESEPIIATPNGVREPQNRRVEISFP